MPITETEIADHVAGRIVEADQYQLNIDCYLASLEGMPQGDVPMEIEQYMGTAAGNLPLSIPDDVVMQIAEYQHRDRLRKLVRTERIQQAITITVRKGLESKLPAGTKQEMIDAASARLKVKRGQ
jgi:hypothetical protein